MMKDMIKYVATAAMGLTILSAPSYADDKADIGMQVTPNLIAQGRNFPDLNAQNFDSSTVYTVTAPSEGATQFRFKLKGYVFGLRMIKANYTGYFDGQNYAAYTDLKTSGLGALLKKLEIWAVTRGTYTLAGLRPDYHVQQNMDKKNRRVEMNYNNALQKVDVDIIPPLGSQGVPPASAEERYRAHDTISAILSMMMNGQQLSGQVCNGSVPVFDSKQHYNLRMERAGTERVKFMDEKVDTIRCNVYYEPVSGFDPEDLPDAEEGETPVKVYFTKLDDANLYVPVRFSYKISAIKATIKVDDMVIIPPK